MTKHERFEVWYEKFISDYFPNGGVTEFMKSFKTTDSTTEALVRLAAYQSWQAAIPKGFVLMTEKLSIEQVNGLYYSGHAWGNIDETKEYFEDVYDTLISSRGV